MNIHAHLKWFVLKLVKWMETHRVNDEARQGKVPFFTKSCYLAIHSKTSTKIFLDPISIHDAFGDNAACQRKQWITAKNSDRTHPFNSNRLFVEKVCLFPLRLHKLWIKQMQLQLSKLYKISANERQKQWCFWKINKSTKLSKCTIHLSLLSDPSEVLTVAINVPQMFPCTHAWFTNIHFQMQ